MLSLGLTILLSAAFLTTANVGPQVAVLPFENADGVTRKQAAGVTAIFREKVDTADFLELLKTRRNDKKTVRKCKRKAKCLGRAAFVRGADLLVWGEVQPHDKGFGVYLVVYEPKAKEALRQVIGEVIGGEEDIDARMARMIREALAPNALAGGMVVRGEPQGASVFLDGKLAGELPTEPTSGIIEGEHVLRVEKDGYYPSTRPVMIRFGEISIISVTLVSKRKKFVTSKMFVDEDAESEVSLVGPIATASIGGVIAGVAAALGTVSLLDSLEVERRASTNNLLFPRDAPLVQRGRLLSTLSTVTWVAAGVVLAGAGGWLGVSLALADDGDDDKKSEEVERLDGPVDGAPSMRDLVPTVE